MRSFVVSLIVIATMTAACSDQPTTNEQASTTTTQPVQETTPPTTGEFGNTIVEPTELTRIDFEALDAGETILADWVDGCGGGIWPAQELRYLADRRLATPSTAGYLLRSDFPPNWDVFVYNDEASDGPSFAILNVLLTQIDGKTIEMREESGELIANFVLDETDPDEWKYCG